MFLGTPVDLFVFCLLVLLVGSAILWWTSLDKKNERLENVSLICLCVLCPLTMFTFAYLNGDRELALLLVAAITSFITGVNLRRGRLGVSAYFLLLTSLCLLYPLLPFS